MKALDTQMQEAGKKINTATMAPQIRQGFVQSKEDLEKKLTFYTGEAENTTDPVKKQEYQQIVETYTKTIA